MAIGAVADGLSIAEAAGDGRHQSDRNGLCVQHRALLDVQLKEAVDARGHRADFFRDLFSSVRPETSASSPIRCKNVAVRQPQPKGARKGEHAEASRSGWIFNAN
jgi:hypothetical protein